MKENIKKAVLSHDRPKLTVTRNQAKSEVQEKEQAKKQEHKKWTMPDERHGYIKSKKHDCL